MKETLTSIGAFTFLGSLLLFVCALVLLLISLAIKTEEKKQKLQKFSLRMLLFSFIAGMVGFGVCSAFFELNLH